MIYDAAVIGTGPAGLSAALNLKILNKSFVWLGSKTLSDKITRAERISNYPGLTRVTGEEMNAAFRAQIEEMGIEITELMVNSIISMGDHYALMAGSEFFESRTVILATGAARKQTLIGESELLGRGVSYCATCDGELYRGKTIAVICGNARFEHEVKYLAELAEKVYLFTMYKDASLTADNIEFVSKKAVEIVGEKRVSGVKLADDSVIEVNGVFCLRDSVALNTLLPKLDVADGHIAVDRGMNTNLAGVYAAGDCTGRPYQYAKAVGEGNVAAHGAVEYLARFE